MLEVLKQRILFNLKIIYKIVFQEIAVCKKLRRSGMGGFPGFEEVTPP